MNSLVDLYVQQLRTSFLAMLQYRASLFIWMISTVLQPLVYLIVWTTVANSGVSVGDYTAGQFAAYFIILMLVDNATYTWIMYEYEYRIRQGMLSFVLLRPAHPIHADIADNISSKMITLPILLVVAAVLAVIFKPTATIVPWEIALFVPVLLLAFLLRFILEWTLAQAAFWTTRVSAFNQTYFVLLLFLSGQIAPLSLFPYPVRLAANILPFRWMVGFPVELLLGRLSLHEALTGLAVQGIWLAASLFLLRLVWRLGLRIYSAVGA